MGGGEMEGGISSQDPRRRDMRAAARVPAVVHTLRGEACGLVLDLSQNGARLFMDEPFDCGGEVLVHWLEHEAYGVVSWSRGHECGVRFTRPLEQSELALQSPALVRSTPVDAVESGGDIETPAETPVARPEPRVPPALTAGMIGRGPRPARPTA